MTPRALSPFRRRRGRRPARLLAVAALAAFGMIATTLVLAGPAQAAGFRVDLKVLVLSSGGPEEAIATALDTEGVPYIKINLNQAGRPAITAAYLSDTVSGVKRAKFQAIVMPNEAPAGVTAAEQTAIATYQKTFQIRRVLAYTYANPTVGLNYAVPPGFLGTLDGKQATVSAAGLAGPFGYLKGSFTFEDGASDVSETYGYVSTPLAVDPVAGGTFTPLLTTPLQDGTPGSLAGVHAYDGREDLVLTYSSQSAQAQFRNVQHGLITWMTRGVHLGINRNYFNVDVDDVFAFDARWDTANNCTPGEDCPAGITSTDIRMTPADVDNAVAWQKAQNFKLNMVYNGFGSDQVVADTGSDALLTKFQAQKAQFRWINHTYEHTYLGCLQNTTVIPWVCTKNAAGAIQYRPTAEIRSEIRTNVTWATQKGFPITRTELVTGEHSGLFLQSQQPADNPNFVTALRNEAIAYTASDASRDPNQRTVGTTKTVPRYPISVYFNVGTKAEMMDEYSHIYTSRADGGSGVCEDNPLTVTCISPKSEADFDSYLVPLETTIAMRHVVANDPRPHYVHQNNLTEGRILYPVLDSILARYRSTFAANTPIVQPTMTAVGQTMSQMATWKANQSRVTAYTLNNRVYVSAPSGVSVPVTAPTGTQEQLLLLRTAFGEAYQGERSAWETGVSTLVLPA